MEKKEALATITVLILFTGFIFTGFNWMLSARINPLETRIDRIETRMDRIEQEMKEIKGLLTQILLAQNAHHKSKTKPASKSKKAIKAKSTERKTASH